MTASKRWAFHLHLYADSVRGEIQQVQKFFKVLGMVDERNKLDLGREFFGNLPRKNCLRRKYDERWLAACESDLTFADMFFNPRETTLTFD